MTVCTAVKGKVAVVSAEMLSPGTHINAIGGDCPGKTELHRRHPRGRQVFHRIHTADAGGGRNPAGGAELSGGGAVGSAGRGEGRAYERRRHTVFDSVGFAIEDFSALRLVHDLTAGRRKLVDLIPDIADPKNLYGELISGAVAPTKVVELA